ncbi:hypothetical protein [Pantoea sp. M_9]|uniref:hypothetical protein n=1 Tax=Pantoea sp. M_9 TaxID=2608041 RepID=UPI001680C12C|nr:hypothetical protein [Pantoea sp. M_9]
MAISKTQSEKWQRWLSFSAFTLAGIALEGSQPAAAVQAEPRPAAKARRWRSVQ